MEPADRPVTTAPSPERAGSGPAPTVATALEPSQPSGLSATEATMASFVAGPPPEPTPEWAASPTAVGTLGVAAPAVLAPGVDHAAATPRGSRRRPWRIVAWSVAAAVVVAVVACSIGYAAVARRDAQHNYRSARAWQDQATAAQRSVADQQARLVAGEHEVAELKAEVARLTAARDGAVARGEGLQGLLDDANRRLAEAEARVATLAGAQARAGDQAIIGR